MNPMQQLKCVAIIQTNKYIPIYIYRVIQEESAILWEMILFVILSKKVHMNMGPIFGRLRS